MAIEVKLIKYKGTIKNTSNITEDTGIFHTISEAIQYYGDRLKALDFNTKQPLYGLYQTAIIDMETGERIPFYKETTLTDLEKLHLANLKQFNKIGRLNSKGKEDLELLLQKINSREEIEIFINPFGDKETTEYKHSSENYIPEHHQVHETYLVAEQLINPKLILKNFEISEERGNGQFNELIDNIIGWVHLYKGEDSQYSQKLIREDYPTPNYIETDNRHLNQNNPFINTYDEFIEKLRTNKKYSAQFKPSKTKLQSLVLSQEENHLDGQSIEYRFSPIPEEEFLHDTGYINLPYKLIKTWIAEDNCYQYIRDYTQKSRIKK